MCDWKNDFIDSLFDSWLSTWPFDPLQKLHAVWYKINDHTCPNKHKVSDSLQVAYKLISPWCRIFASVNWVHIGSGNGLSPVRGQAITWTNADLLSVELPGTNFSEIWIGILSFSFQENASEIFFCQNGGHFVQGERSYGGCVDGLLWISHCVMQIILSGHVLAWYLALVSTFNLG